MRKVLILAYDFPPYSSVGALRPYSWYRYLKEYGYTPIVITRQWENSLDILTNYVLPSKSDKVVVEEEEYGFIYRTPYTPALNDKIFAKHGERKYNLARKIITAYYELGQYFLPIGTKREIYKAAKDVLEKEKIELIIATGEPFVLFKFAIKLSKQHNIPWIADYRDPWSLSKMRAKNKLLSRYYGYFERKFNRAASKVITISPLMCSLVQNPHPEKFVIIKNGYDEKISEKTKDISQNNDVLTISLAGSIYKHQPIFIFLRTINELVGDHQLNLKLNFYGVKRKERIEDYIEKHCPHLQDITTCTLRLSNDEVMEYLAASNLLLVFNSYAVTGTKVFDYLSLNRKIIMCFTDDAETRVLFEKHYPLMMPENTKLDVLSNLLEETQSGISVRDPEHLKEVMLELHQEFSKKGMIESNTIGVEQFTRNAQVKVLADLLTSVIEENENKT